jgi:hypothetical protein
MTTTSNTARTTDLRPAGHPDQDVLHPAASTHPQRMPAGGWIRDVALSENWRTTTIVQRHRDRAARPAIL